MNETTKRVAISPSDDESEIVKVRIQSTPEKINNFKKLMERCEELGMCEMQNFSDIYSNKGTSKYFRAYSDILILDKMED